MKKIVAAMLCAVLVFTLAGCKRKKEPDTRPVLRVGMECGYVPYNWESYDGSFDGVDIKSSARYANGYDTKIAQKIADRLDCRLQVVKLDWTELAPSLRSGKIDMIIAGLSPYESDDIVFSLPYYESDIVVVVKDDGDYKDAESINDFQDAIIGAQMDTVHETLFAQMQYINDERFFGDYDSMIAALQDGEIDGYIAEFPVAVANAEKYEGFTYIKLENNGTGFEIDEESATVAVAMRKGDSRLETVNEVIGSLSESDREKLMKKCIQNQP